MNSLLYRSSYLNSTIALRTDDGDLIGLVAGKHQRYFPYFHEQSKWDNLLLFHQGVGYAWSAKDIVALRIELIEPCESCIAFHGQHRGSDGRIHDLDFELRFDLTPEKSHALAKIIDHPWAPGMRWQPFFCTLLPGKSRFVLDGRAVSLLGGHGELERGELTNLTWRTFAVRYDYCCLAQPDAGHVILDFTTRSLTRRNHVERVLDQLLCRVAALSLRLPATKDDAPRVVSEPQVLIEDRVDLGLALLDRQLITVRDELNHELIGLREIFHPREDMGKVYDERKI